MPAVHQGGLRVSRLREADSLAEHLHQLSFVGGGGGGGGNGDDDLTTSTTTATTTTISSHTPNLKTEKVAIAVKVAVSLPRAPGSAPGPALTPVASPGAELYRLPVGHVRGAHVRQLRLALVRRRLARPRRPGPPRRPVSRRREVSNHYLVRGGLGWFLGLCLCHFVATLGWRGKPS